MKHLIKKLMLSCLSLSGFLYFRHYRNKHKITVLMLHGVMHKHKNITWEPLRPQISPNELKRVFEILSCYYQFITVDQCIDMLEEKIPIINNGLLMTFDDGYRNNIDYALPICEMFGIKPVLFVSTSHVDSGLPFWFDRLDYALQQNMGKLISFSFEGNKYTFDATSRDALRVSFQKFRDDCKLNFTDDIAMNQLFNALSEMLEMKGGKALSDICLNDDWSAVVSWDNLREVVKKGRLDVASHSVDHWRLDRLSKKQILLQLSESKKRIEQELGISCNYFCYPNGDYSREAMDLIKKSRYRAAFSTGGGVCEVNDDLIKLKRFYFPVNKQRLEILYQLNQ